MSEIRGGLTTPRFMTSSSPNTNHYSTKCTLLEHGSFLFLSVPPVNLVPPTLANGDYAIENEGLAIQYWNKRLVDLATRFRNNKNESITTFVHDTHVVYSAIIEDPANFEQTKGIENTTGYCTAYAKYVLLYISQRRKSNANNYV